MKKGMTLVEILISLVILMFLLGAVYSILNLQTVRAIQVQKTSVLQTDAQIALTLMKWDLSAAGLAFPKVDSAVVSGDGGFGGSDSINLKAVGLGFESSRVRWSWLLEKVTNKNMIIVRAWDDPMWNFNSGDSIVVLDRDRKIMNPPGDLEITSPVDTFTYTDQWGNPVKACSISISNPLNAIAGLVVISKIQSLYSPGIKISVNANNELVRGKDILLDNVEDLQFAYGVDTDGDGIIDSWSDNKPLQAIALGQKWVIRYTLVVTSRPMGGYTYPDITYTIENHTYDILTNRMRMKRAIFTGIIAPPNLQPPEGG